MLLFLQFFVIAAIAFFNASLCCEYTAPAKPRPDPNLWANMNEENDKIYETEDNHRYQTYKSNEISIFSLKYTIFNRYWQECADILDLCIKFDESHRCGLSLKGWLWFKNDDSDWSYLRRIELGSPYIYNDTKYLMDVDTFFTPYFTYLLVDHDFKVEIHRTQMIFPSTDKYSHTMILKEHSDRCSLYRPKVDEASDAFWSNHGVNAMRTAFYYNYKGKAYKSYAYLFIKKKANICIYRMDISEWKNNYYVIPLSLVEFSLINNYPTENYAPHFFAFDPLMGAFASLYWDQVPGHPPEVHFYVFDEDHPTAINKFNGGYALTGFNEAVLKEIFKGKYEAEARPSFVSFGQQVFISFTPNGSDGEWKSVGRNTVYFPDRAYIGLWKDSSTHYLLPNLPESRDAYQRLIHLQKDYIRITKPLMPPGHTVAPVPISTTSVYVPETTTTITTTAPEDTSSSAVSTSTSSFAESTTQKISTSSVHVAETTIPLTSTASEGTSSSAVSTGNSSFAESTTQKVSTLSSSTTTEPSRDNPHDIDGHAAANDGESNTYEAHSCDGRFSYLWLLILFIFLDVILIILFIILIIVSLRGAKKRNGKHSMTKSSKSASSKTKPVRAKKSKKSVVAPPTPKKDTKKMKKKENPESKKKKKAVEKTVDAKKTTTADQSNYYTIDATFKHSSSKKKIGKK